MMSALNQRIQSSGDAKRLARRRLPRLIYDFIGGAAGYERAARANLLAFEKTKLMPRVLVNVNERTLNKNVLDKEMGLPFGIAPMGMCNMAWPNADHMFAKAAVDYKIPFCVSTASSTTLEDCYRESEGQAWFQLYSSTSYEFTLQLIKRAQAVGYTHLVLTVDVPQVARRIRDLKNGFRVPFRLGPRQLWDFTTHPQWSLATLIHGVPRPKNFAKSGLGSFERDSGRSTVEWEFLDQLRSIWQNKLIIKGVLCTEDALKIKNAGADAIYVSNHGGRQLDSSPPAIEMLPTIRSAVGSEYPLLLDSGVRSGEDIIKALALGADFVMIGSALLYSIGADGKRGLATLIHILKEETSVAMAQIGLRRISDISSEVLASKTNVGKSINSIYS